MQRSLRSVPDRQAIQGSGCRMRMGNGEKSSLTKDVPGMKLEERDLVEEFSRAGGRGGQNVQKVETRVVLRHLPTGITVVAQEERFREANRLQARRRMVQALADRERRIRLAKAAERSRERSRTAKRSRCAKKELVEGKRKRAMIKVGRGKWRGEV
ncbi:MAG: peptide chain release factor-like protein [Verrucomicrobia bacterium]|nr:peptide chain release factor-like protein [Verrucomicrobiota bacterium]